MVRAADELCQLLENSSSKTFIIHFRKKKVPTIVNPTKHTVLKWSQRLKSKLRD